MKILKNLLLVLLGVLILQACNSTEQFKQAQADVREAVTVYENQLVTSGQPYAVISGQPKPADLSLVRSPYVVQSIDGKALVTAEYSFVKARPLPRDLAFSSLRIPVGTHDLVITGGRISTKRTTFNNVLFEANKKYVITESKTTDKSVKIYIAEYVADTRFNSYESDFYVIGKAITPIVDLGKQVNSAEEQK